MLKCLRKMHKQSQNWSGVQFPSTKLKTKTPPPPTTTKQKQNTIQNKAKNKKETRNGVTCKMTVIHKRLLYSHDECYLQFISDLS